ncbi:hypothetical protein [Brevibacillus centrosporus]|uniref:hypothetical protein n=1 Tax=Brevibacillus centrosporus TaxID=54910 RepID=UPI003D194284
MEYTVQKLGLLAGVSTRTLRYYDEIGIRAKYGEQQINKSYQKLKGMTEEEHARLEDWQTRSCRHW